MATSAYASTPETTYATRTCRVLLGPCSDQLRDVLRHYVPQVNFPHVIRQKRLNLSRLTLPQKSLIFPRTGSYSGDYSDMDISLLYILLRNICNIQPHMNGWGNSPDVNDHSLGANIERIRVARNQVGHSTRSSLSHTDFLDLWSYIKDAVKSMDAFLNNGNKYEKEMDFLFTETMDPEQEDFFREKLRKQVEEDTRTREMIIRLQESVKDHQEGIKDLRTQQQELQRQHTYQYTKFSDSFQVHSAQIADLSNRIEQTRVIQDEEPSVNRLKDRLIEINDLKIPLTPLQENSDQLPIEQLFASVIIKEDSKETREEKKSVSDGKEHERKEVKTPEDMLTKNGKPVRRVYMLGDAAHGKTTYCTWLLKKWCNAQNPGKTDKALNEWEIALSQFEFVFHLKFRHVGPSRADVTDMICQDILGEDTALHTTAKHVLSSDKFRCLIIMDGLDEWKPNQSATDQLKYKGMPNIDNMSNCVIFTTMRPWMFAAVAGLVGEEDRVIEIQGLDNKGVEDVIEKVLVHYYELNEDSAKYITKYREIIVKLQDKTLKSFIHIPLLAVVCIQIWCEGEQLGESLTSFYTAMVNMLIERALLKHQIEKVCPDTTNHSLPRILSAKKNINCFSNNLLKLGKVAYDGLISNQMKLVFQKDELESEIGERELQFALDVGLISQKEAPSITTRKVNVHFFHKSVQEFLAVIYIVTHEKVCDSFCTRLCNVKVIMELSNVIKFICGVCPSLGSVISQRVVSVTDSDEEICQYRESLDYNDTVNELYKLQIDWYRELQYAHTDSRVTQTHGPLTKTNSPVTFHLSDVYLSHNSGKERVREIGELLLDKHVDIRSLSFISVPNNREDGITNSELDDFLSNTDSTRSLVMLSINGVTGRFVHTLCIPSLRILNLSGVTILDRNPVHRPVMTDMDRVQTLQLNNLRLGDRDLGLTPQMTDIQKIVLSFVDGTQSGWRRLIQSFIDIHHQFVVTLYDTDIDSDSISTLHSSPHLSVTQDVRHGSTCGCRYIEFTRVWPHTTQ